MERLSFVKNGVINYEDPRINIYPRTLEDDGMGYGINEKLITSVNFVDDNNCNIFIDEVTKFDKTFDDE